MKPKTMVLMMVAVGCGLVASYMTSRLIADRGTTQEPRIKVLVAKKKLKQLTLLNKPEELFMEKELPVDAIPKKAVKSFEELKDKRLNKGLTEESLVTTDDLINKDLAGLAASLPQGMRATALRVNPESLAGGFVLPGSRVDVVHTSNDGEAVSQIILQDMLVLAVDLQSNFDPEKQPTMLGSTVTLAITPEDATRLALAGRLGELRLLLRPLGDTEKIQTRGSKRKDLSRPNQGGGGELPAPDTQLASADKTKIPELPPVPGDPPANPMQEMPEPVQEDPLKTHKLTIISGDGQTTHTFLQEKDGTWKLGGSDRKAMDGEDPRPNKPRAAWPKVGVPAAEKKDEPKAADPAPQPPNLQDFLLKNSGLPPVNSGNR